MNFELTDEQRMLATTVGGSLSAVGPLRLGKDGGCIRPDRADLARIAKTLGQTGILGLLAPESSGGSGLGALDALTVAIEAGRRAAAFPLIETMVGAAFLSAASPELAGEVMAGEGLATCASDASLAASDEGPRHFTGSFVAPYLRQCDFVLAPVVSGDAKKVAIFETSTLDVEELPPFDLTSSLGEARLVAPTEAFAVVGGDLDRVLGILACGDLIGAAEECLTKSVEYMKTRVQFDQPIGRNQALKHIAADGHLLIESMGVAARCSAWMIDAASAEGTPGDRHDEDVAFHAAKAYCSSKALKVAKDAVQIHGGIGFTWEHELHLYLRRIQQRSGSFGSAYHHNERLAELAIASSRRRRAGSDERSKGTAGSQP